jgi:ABC-type uncharacterized transport system substrate-binding protein
MSYAVNAADQWRRAAVYGHKILKGRKPADLPVELAITSTALGLPICSGRRVRIC